MINLRKLLHNLGSVTTMRLLSAVLSFVLVTILARTWDLGSFGQFSTLFTFFLLLQQLPLMGLHIFVARQISASPAQVVKHAVNSLMFATLTSLLLVLVVGVLGGILYPKLTGPFWVLAFCCVPTAVTVVAESILVAQERMALIARVNIIENVLRLIVCIALVLARQNLISILLVFLMMRSIAAFIYYYELRKDNIWHFLLINYKQQLIYLRKVRIFLPILVFSVAFGKLDVIMLSQFKTMEQVGLYIPSQRIFELGIMLPGIIIVVLFPVFTRLFTHAREQYTFFLNYLARMILFVGLPIILIFMFLAKEFLELVFGKQFGQTELILQLMSISILIMAIDELMAIAMLAAHKENLDLKSLGISFMVFVLCLLTLIPAFGGVGAAISIVVALSLRLCIRFFYISRYMDISSFYLSAIRIFIAATVMFFTILILGDGHSLFALGAGLTSYVIALYLLKEFRTKDLASLKLVFDVDPLEEKAQ